MTVNKENPQDINTETDSQSQDDVAEEDVDAVSYFDQITNEGSDDDPSERESKQELDTVADEEGEEDDSDTFKTEEDSEEEDALETGESEGSQEPVVKDEEGDDKPDLEKLQREKAKLEQDHRANAMRVRALNEKLAAARETIKKMESSKPEDDITDDELKELEADFPEAARLARIYAARSRKEMVGQLGPIHQAVDSSFERQQQDLQQQELERVAQAHPDYVELVPKIQDWVSQQSQGIKALYESNSADDAIALLNLYKQAHAVAPAAPKKPAEKEESASKPPKKADLSQHAELPRKGASRSGVEPDDPVEIFNAIT